MIQVEKVNSNWNDLFALLKRAILSRLARQPLSHPTGGSEAAVSLGIVDGEPFLDLDYARDVRADVDMNVVMTGEGKFIEIQGTGEGATFDDDQLASLLKLAKQGIRNLSEIQRQSLGGDWPW